MSSVSQNKSAAQMLAEAEAQHFTGQQSNFNQDFYAANGSAPLRVKHNSPQDRIPEIVVSDQNEQWDMVNHDFNEREIDAGYRQDSEDQDQTGPGKASTAPMQVSPVS